ncbi:hypothetical protein [Amycolatopsis sp. RTGN1]|uniref:hypothetical protein n=1 Tax=Amycolatopsis ponsaeliensis TaxID=2992142 RepID=UPI002551BDC8|nr:hypothetical protein [Amycolatopsis sp. RTGN1]
MTELIRSAAHTRAAEIRRKLKRNKLVFVQCGAAFEVLRAPLLAELDGTLLDSVSFAATSDPVDPPTGRVILDNVEAFAADGKAGSATLGALRARVNQLRDDEIDVCLVSRMPKIAFAPVAGSNLLDDAAWHCIPCSTRKNARKRCRQARARRSPRWDWGRIWMCRPSCGPRSVSSVSTC